MLNMEFGVFWFVTVLWVSQNLFNLIFRIDNRIFLLPLLIVLGYCMQWLNIALPWNIQVVPMAISYIWIGFMMKKYLVNKFNIRHSSGYVLLSIIVLCAVFIFRDILTLDMKYTDFGFTILSFIASILSSLSLAIIAVCLSTLNRVSKYLCIVGSASMVIMYLHQPIKYILLRPIGFGDNHVLVWVASIMISLIVYILMNQFRFTKKLI